MRIVGIVLVSIILNTGAAGQSLLYKVDLDTRIERSHAIVEGRVVGQSSFWNGSHTLIYTRSIVAVSRVFKGSTVDLVEILTPGGVVGLEASVVHPALELRSGDVGVFFLEEDRKTSDTSAFRPFASVQGFVQYDEARGGASDVFDTYPDIVDALHDPIERQVGAEVRVIGSFEIPRNSPVEALPKVAPVITSITPAATTAGTNSRLTIAGSGFEAYDGGVNSAVLFPNADRGGSGFPNVNVSTTKHHVKSWTDTEIVVDVPTTAGTGKVAVQNASQQTGTSLGSLTIEFNRIQVLFDSDEDGSPEPFTPDLIDKNFAGGYSLAMSTSTANNGVNFLTGPGLAPFESALATWRGGTGFNMKNNGGQTASNVVDPASDPDIVMFDNDAEPLPAGILGRANGGYTGCSAAGSVMWWMQGVDIVFRRDGSGITWNFGPGEPTFQTFDFESVAVHELGHAHQLGHIIAPEKVMHYAITNGENVRSLDPVSDIAGGLDVLANVGEIELCGKTPMTPLVGVGVAVEEDELPSGFSIGDPFPNPFSDQAEFSLSVQEEQHLVVDLYDVLGRPVLTLFRSLVVPSRDYRIAIDGGDLTPGVYLVRVTGERFSATRLVTRVDGF